eukprot:SAG25_NODE_67_length_17436_cov_89.239257_4_plen_78_part_00
MYFEPPLEMLTLSLSAGATPPQSAGLLWLPRTRGELSPAQPRRCMSKMPEWEGVFGTCVTCHAWNADRSRASTPHPA